MNEAKALKFRFEQIKNRAAFAREHKVPGGQTMIYQHIAGLKPISLKAAQAYARGFNCTLEEISPSNAEIIRSAQVSRSPLTILRSNTDTDAYAANVKSLATPSEKMVAEIIALAGKMSDRGLAQFIERGIALAAEYPKAKANRRN